MDPAEHPARAARRRIPPPPELLASGSRPVSRQSCSPVDPAEYPNRAARQLIPPSIPPSIPPERLASGSRRVSHQRSPPVNPAEYPAEYPRVARQWIPPSILLCRWILPSIRPVSSRSGPPVFASGSLLNVPPGTQLGLHFMLLPSCFECTPRLGNGDAFVLLWVANKQLRLLLRRVSFWKWLGCC